MLMYFTFFVSFILLIVWAFESKEKGNFKYPAIFGFFSVLEYIAIPYASIAVLYIMSYQYSALKAYVTYPTGLLISVIILSAALTVKVANKYL